MSLFTTISHFAMTLVVERPVAHKSISDMVLALQTTDALVHQQLDKAPDTEKNHRLLTHIIGIERWGQRRLKVALGEPFIQDEYTGYRPADAPWRDLVQEFRVTRANTIAITQEITRSGMPIDMVPHNQYGNMSVKGWLRYLNLHAYFESRKMG